jgi:hypothetical protein
MWGTRAILGHIMRVVMLDLFAGRRALLSVPLIRSLGIHVYIYTVVAILLTVRLLFSRTSAESCSRGCRRIRRRAYATVALVEADPVLHPGVRPVPALESAVDDVGDHAAIPRHPPRGGVCGRRRPVAEDHVVARRLGRLRRHPEPERRLERDHRVRVAHQVHAQRVARELVGGLPPHA